MRLPVTVKPFILNNQSICSFIAKEIKTFFVEYYFLKPIFGCFVGFHLLV